MPSVTLVSVYAEPESVQLLYRLLQQRTPEQSISHKKMPTLIEHAHFVRVKPYLRWYLIKAEGEYVGAIYLSRRRELGISVFEQHQGKGYGKAALRAMMPRCPGQFLANINPENARSIAMFAELGFKHIQNTYAL